MPRPGPWITQDTLTGSTTLTPAHDDEDFSGGNGWFTVGISNDSRHGARSNTTDFGQTLASAWDMVRGADPSSDAHTRLSGTTSDWFAGLLLENNTVFGWDATLTSLSLVVDAVAFDDYQNEEWPVGAIDVEVDGDQFWDLRVEAFAEDDTADRVTSLDEYDLVHESAGTWRVANANIDTTTTFPQELLASTPAGSVLDFVNVPQSSNAFLGTRVLPLLDMLAGGPPALDESVPDRAIFYQYTYTFTVGVDITVRRPRYRYIFEGQPTPPPLRQHPRSDGLAVGTARLIPPPPSHRQVGGYR